ncbi:MAG: RNA-binding protein, partial [Jatrophihabitans sp.]
MEGEASDRAAVRLSPPARRRLVELGAETLGRLRPEEVPVALRAVARFTPKGRVQRGGVAIAAALDADDDFRAHVASAVEEALPVLAAAVRGGDTAACDPADVAATAFLLRPPQWLQTVADDVREWDRRQGAGKQVTAERDRMREEVTALTARLKAERASHRTAIAEAVAAVEADLARVRRELRARTEQARDADRARDEAVAALAEEQERAGRAAAAADAEARALRARVAEL